MSEMTREQAYRRWKKGEDPHKLAKEMGVTRERMRYILKKMDASVPLVDRIEELEANLVLMERKCATLCEGWRISDHARIDGEKKLAKAVEALEKLARLGNGERYGNSDGNMIARTTLAELKGQDDDPA